MITLAAGNTLEGCTWLNAGTPYFVFGTEVTAAGVETRKVLASGQASNLILTAGNIYTTPANTTTFIRTIIYSNTSSRDQFVQFSVNGNSAGVYPAIGEGTSQNYLSAITGLIQVPAGHMLKYESSLGWRVVTNRGEELIGYAPYLTQANFGISGSKAETLDRNYLTEVDTSALSSGRLTLQAIWLNAGTVLSSISFCSATTAAGTPTHQIFGLFDSSRNLLMTTVDGTTTAWAANTVKTLALASGQFALIYQTGLYYLGIMVTATTVPTLKGHTTLTASNLHSVAPILNGTADTGLTTALPAAAAAITVGTAQIWGAVS
jgi:hypothetical protein